MMMLDILRRHTSDTPQLGVNAAYLRQALIAVLSALALATLTTGLTIAGYSSSSEDALTAHIPDAVSHGNMGRAIVQCQALFQAWKRVQGNSEELRMRQESRPLLFLCDRKYAEDSRYRSNVRPSFIFPDRDDTNPLSGRVAFYTGVYARENPTRIGDTVQVTPSGYFLVCWSSGKISRFPSEQVRYWRNPRTGERVPLFPGLRG